MKQSKYPLHPEPLYVKISRAEYDALKASVSKLPKTQEKLENADRSIQDSEENENARKRR